MNRHPKILEQLAQLLPPAPYYPGTFLSSEMGLGPAGRRELAGTIEEAFDIKLDDRRVPQWRTLADVTADIAACLALEVA